MKEALKKRPVAILITIVIILLSTLFSIHRTLGAECKAITDGFFTGAYYDGYAHTSVSQHLSSCANAANSLIAITSNYDELVDDSEKLSAARHELLSALKGEDINDIYIANEKMCGYFGSLSNAVGSAELSERDAAGAQSFIDTFNSAQLAINSTRYNDSVREFFRSTINVFPTNYLVRFAGLELPELFE